MTSLLNNRQKQRELETYKTKNEMSEAIFYLNKINFSPATREYINYILKTRGVTQAKVIKICKEIGFSTSTYSTTIKPEIETLLGEPIIEMKKLKNLIV